MSVYNPHSYFRTAVAVTLGFFVVVALFLIFFGKKESFIVVNGSYNESLDYFFQYITILGDGVIYIPIVVYSVLLNRDFLVPLIAGIIICTILTHILKLICSSAGGLYCFRYLFVVFNVFLLLYLSYASNAR